MRLYNFVRNFRNLGGKKAIQNYDSCAFPRNGPNHGLTSAVFHEAANFITKIINKNTKTNRLKDMIKDVLRAPAFTDVCHEIEE